jgi:hypothetical protein
MSPASQGSDLVVLIVIGAGLLLALLIGLTIKLAASWKGVWRLIALLPFLGMAGLVAYMVMHPESAGLWPIVIVFWGVIAMLVLVVITGMHALADRVASRSKGGDDPSDSDDS